MSIGVLIFLARFTIAARDRLVRMQSVDYRRIIIGYYSPLAVRVLLPTIENYSPDFQFSGTMKASEILFRLASRQIARLNRCNPVQSLKENLSVDFIISLGHRKYFDQLLLPVPNDGFRPTTCDEHLDLAWPKQRT